MIYFLRRADGAIKIGTTRKHYTRRSDRIRRYSNLELLGAMAGNREVEHEIHTRFAHLRLDSQRQTEWFQSSQKLLDYIAENSSPEIQTVRKVTVKLSDKTRLLLQSFQNEHFVGTGKRITNGTAVGLAIQVASPEAAEWVEKSLTKGDKSPSNVVSTEKR